MSGASLGSLERVPTWDKSAPTDFFVMGEESGENRRAYMYQIHRVVVFNVVLVFELVEVRTSKPRRHAGKGYLI